jgi:NADH:flavin oxidoreductase / NADH oxidase family
MNSFPSLKQANYTAGYEPTPDLVDCGIPLLGAHHFRSIAVCVLLQLKILMWKPRSLVANDCAPKYLYRNKHDRTFERTVSYLSGFALKDEGRETSRSINSQSPLQKSLAGDGVLHHFRKHYSGTFILNTGIDREHGNQLVRDDARNLIAFGRDFIANPDLVERLRLKAPSTSSALRVTTVPYRSGIPIIPISPKNKSKPSQAKENAHV